VEPVRCKPCPRRLAIRGYRQHDEREASLLRTLLPNDRVLQIKAVRATHYALQAMVPPASVLDPQRQVDAVHEFGTLGEACLDEWVHKWP
jgi:hypothetical protein